MPPGSARQRLYNHGGCVVAGRNVTLEESADGGGRNPAIVSEPGSPRDAVVRDMDQNGPESAGDQLRAQKAAWGNPQV